MATDVRRIPAAIGLALALLISMAARPAAGQQAEANLVPKAIAFVQTLAKGDFQSAEADFTDQMKQAAPPHKLRQAWQQLLSQVGPYQDTGVTRTVDQEGYTTVVVRTDFKSSAVGIAVSFDSARRIAGMHFVPPP